MCIFSLELYAIPYLEGGTPRDVLCITLANLLKIYQYNSAPLIIILVSTIWQTS